MPKKRRTRKYKERVQKNLQQREIIGFKVKIDGLDLSKNSSKKAKKTEKQYKSYLRADLTKTMGLTMLAVALELALWHYLFR